MNFPRHITFLSDLTEAILIEEIKGKKDAEISANYKFTKATVNLGLEFPLFLKDIERLKSCGYCLTDSPNLADKSNLMITHTTV